MLYVANVLVSSRPLELRISNAKERTSHPRFSDPNAFSRAFSERVSGAVLRPSLHGPLMQALRASTFIFLWPSKRPSLRMLALICPT